MRKYILDFIFDEFTGESHINIDFHDDSLTQMEINQMVMEGELRNDILEKAGQVFGEEIVNKINSGEIKIICLDDHPEDRDVTPVLQNLQKSETEENRRENII